MIPLLTNQTLSQANPRVVIPNYDRQHRKAGIVHLGIGGFHRAHQAVYTEQVLANTDSDWMIIGASLFRPTTRDRLEAQDSLYSVTTQTENTSETRIIGAVKKVLFAPDDPAALIRLMSEPETRIISLTITEKGYCRDANTGRLAPDHESVEHALTESPTTAIGYLVASLKLRREQGHPPVTLLSCDNLYGNGTALKQVILDFAALWDDSLTTWIESNVSFPNTMVDRIVPAQTNDLTHQVATTLGLRDAACIATEPFCQWIIEDSFAAGRPDWQQAGATFSSEVHLYETMKLRLLNGAHSAIAYLGLLADKTTVAECMQTPALYRFILDLMQHQIAPSIQVPAGCDINEYITQLIKRFANASLQHQCSQIAMDGSQKLPQRLLKLSEERLTQGKSTHALCCVIAAWMLYARGVNLQNVKHNVIDPLNSIFSKISVQHGNSAAQLVDAYLSIDQIFSPLLRESSPFRLTLIETMQAILTLGITGAIEQYRPGAEPSGAKP